MNMIRYTTKEMQQGYNYGKGWASDMMQYCASSVEKYMFSKLYDTIFAMYLYKSQEEDKIVREKITTCHYSGRLLMKKLEVKEQYMALSEEEEKQGKIGYDSAVECINKIERTCYPNEKLNNIIQMYSEMRTAAIDCSKGKYELTTMDDQMSVFIFIMIKCNLKNPVTELNFLFDYLNYKEDRNDMEQLLITNMQVNIL